MRKSFLSARLIVAVLLLSTLSVFVIRAANVLGDGSDGPAVPGPFEVQKDMPKSLSVYQLDGESAAEALVPSSWTESRSSGTGRASKYLFTSYAFSRRVSYEYKPDGSPMVVLTTSERDPTTLSKDSWTSKYAVSFLPRLFDSFATSERFAVAGYSRTGDVVIEVWSYRSVPGAYFNNRAFPTTGLGVPATVSSNSLSIDGSFQPVADRTYRREVLREEIYRGTVLSRISLMEADPEGRFVLGVSGVDGMLVQFPTDTSSGAFLQVLYTSNDIPLLSSATSMLAAQHMVKGRGFRIRNDASGECVYLWDDDNDGVFDSVESHADDQNDVLYPIADFVDLATFPVE